MLDFEHATLESRAKPAFLPVSPKGIFKISDFENTLTITRFMPIYRVGRK
jgi:hypothetical protein